MNQLDFSKLLFTTANVREDPSAAWGDTPSLSSQASSQPNFADLLYEPIASEKAVVEKSNFIEDINPQNLQSAATSKHLSNLVTLNEVPDFSAMPAELMLKATADSQPLLTPDTVKAIPERVLDINFLNDDLHAAPIWESEVTTQKPNINLAAVDKLLLSSTPVFPATKRVEEIANKIEIKDSIPEEQLIEHSTNTRPFLQQTLDIPSIAKLQNVNDPEYLYTPQQQAMIMPATAINTDTPKTLEPDSSTFSPSYIPPAINLSQTPTILAQAVESSSESVLNKDGSYLSLPTDLSRNPVVIERAIKASAEQVPLNNIINKLQSISTISNQAVATNAESYEMALEEVSMPEPKQCIPSAIEQYEHTDKVMNKAITEGITSAPQAVNIQIKQGGEQIQQVKATELPLNQLEKQFPQLQHSLVEQVMSKLVPYVQNKNTDSIKIALHPAELGGIEISFDFSDSKQTKVDILTEKFMTYDLLSRNIKEIEEQLQGNIKSENGSLNFGLKNDNQESNENRQNQLKDDDSFIFVEQEIPRLTTPSPIQINQQQDKLDIWV